MVFQSPRPPVEVPRVPVTDFILEKAAGFAERAALIDAITDRRMTYAGLEATIGRATAGLAARGYGRGDVFGIFSPNTLEYPLAFHGVARLGGVVTRSRPALRAAARPRFCWRTNRVAGKLSTTAAGSSDEPSSTTTTASGSGRCANTLASASPRKCA